MVSFCRILSDIGINLQLYSTEVKAVLFVLYMVICLTALILIGTIIFILATKKNLRTQLNIANSSLLVCGLILVGAVLPMLILGLVIKGFETNEVYQAIRSYLSILYVILTIESIVYIAIVRAYQLRSMRTLQNQISKTVLVAIRIAILFIAISYPAFVAYIGILYKRIGVARLFIVSIVLTVIILRVAYGLIWYEIKKSNDNITRTSSQSVTVSYRRKAAKSILLVMVAFMLTHIFMIVAAFVLIYNAYNSQRENENTDLFNALGTAVLMIASLDVSINAVIYLYMQSRIRK